MHMPDLSTIFRTVDHVERGFLCTIMRQQPHLIFECQMEEYSVLWLRLNGVRLIKYRIPWATWILSELHLIDKTELHMIRS